MLSLATSVQHHQVLYTLGGYYVFSAAVGAMPAPMPNGNAFYSWVFHFLQTLGANLTRVIASKYPQVTNGSTAQKAGTP
jgi:hypothetical protein